MMSFLPCTRVAIFVLAGLFVVLPLYAQQRYADTPPQQRLRVDSQERRVERAANYLQEQLDIRTETRRNSRLAAAKGRTSFAVDADETDSLALVALYNSTNGDGWVNNQGWLEGTVANWAGVVLDAQGRVVELDFTRNNLNGTLPAEITDLTALEFLEMGENLVSGPLPENIGEMSNLIALVAWGNQLSGELPASIGDLTLLRELWLFDNALSGEIPAKLGNAISLEILYLDQNFFNGEIPSDLENLFFLQELFLDFNELTGPIPDQIGNLVNLKSLFLRNNRLTGGIPSSLGQLQGLQLLSLSENPLGGSIPLALYALGNLTTLELGGIGITGALGPEFGGFGSLSNLDLSDNEFSGGIPFEFGFAMQNIKRLDLSNNQFTGPIPPTLNNGVINYLDLSFNRLNGNIPNEISISNRISHLYLNDNELSGVLPFGLSELVRLVELDLSGNQLNGTIPRWLVNPLFIKAIIMGRNQFSGELPADLARLDDLELLDFFQNNLTGAFPEIVGDMESLLYLDLGENNLEGPLPAVVGEMTQLQDLYLDGNAFSGVLPDELGQLASIERMYLNNNAFSGALPAALSNLTNLQVLLLQDNALYDVPPLNWTVKPDTVDLRRNALTFADLEPNLEAATSVRYIPQADVPTFWTRENGNVQFFVDVDGSSNAYQWYRNGATEAGAVASMLVNTGSATEDTLHVQIINPLVPGLVLNSIPVRSDAELTTISVSPDMAQVFAGNEVTFMAAGEDQFGNFLGVKPQWAAEGGTIDSRGYFTAGEVPGVYTITATGPEGLLTATASVEVIETNPTSTTPVPHPVAGEARLHPNFPNPFRGKTTLRFDIPHPGSVRLQVYDILGRLQATLVDQQLPAGTHLTEFFAGNYPPGLYLVRLTAGGQIATQKVLLAH